MPFLLINRYFKKIFNVGILPISWKNSPTWMAWVLRPKPPRRSTFLGPIGTQWLANQCCQISWSIIIFPFWKSQKFIEIWGPSSSSSILSSTQRSYQAGSIPLRHPIKTSHEYIPWISNSSGESLTWSHRLSLKVRKDLPRTWHPPDCREVDPGAPGVWGLLKIYHNWYGPAYE